MEDNASGARFNRRRDGEFDGGQAAPTQGTKSGGVFGSLDAAFKVAIAGMSQCHHEVDSGQLNRIHEARALSGSMSGQASLEHPFAAKPDIVAGVMQRGLKVEDIDHGREIR